MGIMVGTAVRKGTGNQGAGRCCISFWSAFFLTYFAIGLMGLSFRF